MANNASCSGANANQNFELVAPVKILVKPGLSGAGPTTSIRRRSISVIPCLNEAAGGGESENIFLGSNPANIPRHEERRSETIIQIESSSSCENKNVAYYLRHCLRLMYLSGMSTYNPDTNENGKKETWMLRCLQKAFFWKVTSVSLFFSGLCLKQAWIMFEAGKGVPKLVFVGSWLFTITSEVYYTYLFAFCHKEINGIMTALKNLESYSIEEIGNGKWKCRNPTKLITVMFAASIFACFMYPVGRLGIQEWSPKKMMLDSSERLSMRFFVWDPDDFSTNSTKLPTLKQEYGTTLTTVTFFMGIIEIWMRFCSNMKMDTALNIGIVVAILTWIRLRHFAKKIKSMDFNNFANGYDTEELDSPTGLFAEFKQIRKENRLLNKLVGGLLKIIHGYNLMQCTTFLMRCLDHRATITQLGFLVYNLMKVAVMYYFGKKAAVFNALFEQWIVDWSMYSTDHVFLGRVTAILHEMKNEPLGLGRGNFLVGQGFMFRFLGFVGSIFMLEVDDDD